MKRTKQLLALLLILTLLLALAPASFARGSIAVSGGLTKQSGNKYTLSGKVSTATPENLSVYVYLYNDNTGDFIDGVRNEITNDTLVTTSKTVTLSSGKYRVEVYGYGNTQSGGVYYIYTI